MKHTKLRWGILSAAEIAQKNYRGIYNSGNSIVVGVASRDESRARRFVELCQAEASFDEKPQVYPGYDELLANPEIDAVYIPLPTVPRKRWVLRAAEAGKHVLCEKPCAATVADMEEMLAACARNRVQFMDGVMFVHSQRLEAMSQCLRGADGVGEIRRIQSAFSFGAPESFWSTNIRAGYDLEPLGCLGDLGWYCIRFSLWAMGWQMPVEVTGRMLVQRGRPGKNERVPSEFSGELLYANGVSAAFFCSFIAQIQQWGIVSGTEGYLAVRDFVLPVHGKELTFDLVRSSYHVSGTDFRMEAGRRTSSVPEHSHGHRDAQEARMMRNFADTVLAGRINTEWPDVALKTQKVMCACLESARAGGRPAAI
jgi:predicted dehydrogenase